MTELLNQLFGLEGLGFGDEGVRIGFARPIAAWGWLLAVAAALGLSAWSYSRLAGARWGRIALAGVRGALLLALVLVVSGPELVRENVRVERDWVLVLVDRSASMGIGDVEAGGGRTTREEQLREALRVSSPAWAQLARDREVVWMGFDSGAYDLEASAAPGGVALRLEEPTGRRTSLGAALDQALQRAAARPVSGVVVISDGRSVDEPGRAALRRLEAEKIPVVSVPLGSAEAVTDLAVERAEAPALAFVNDTVPVSVRIDRLGAGSVRGGTVRLIDKATGRVLDEKRLPADEAAWAGEGGEPSARVTLTTRTADPGKSAWVVRLEPDGPDLIEENNRAELNIELVDRPMRVAYFDGYPRWEYRYLKNLLVREGSIESSAVLLAANRQYLQEGDVILESMPRSPEEWAPFDVIVLGDLPASLFSNEQLEQIREQVAVRGAGLLWIGGPGATPHAWRGTPLADLMPFTLGSPSLSAESATVTSSVRPYTEPVLMFPGPAAERLGLLQMGEAAGGGGGWLPSLSDPAAGWSQLRYAQRITPEALKPTAEVIAWARPVSGAEDERSQTPLVVSMRYGAGRVLYVGTDEVWRWRYARGEVLPERFWLPLIRLQGRESLARSAQSAMLEVTPRRAEVHQPVRVQITLLDQSLLEVSPAALAVRVVRVPEPGEARIEAGSGGHGGMELTLRPEGDGDPAAQRVAKALAATWLPDEPGRYRVEASDPLLAGLGLSAEVQVAWPDDEMRHPETDHEMLARLSEQTEGRVLPASQLSQIADPALLPRREVRITGAPEVRSLWDRPVVLVVVLLLLTLEWVGRKVIRLV